jgi:hypothetical protein
VWQAAARQGASVYAQLYCPSEQGRVRTKPTADAWLSI